MKKGIYIITSIMLLGLAFAFGSCSDDDNKNSVSQEWIDYQNRVYLDSLDSGKYVRLSSLSGNGEVCHRASDYINKNIEKEKEGIEEPKEVSKGEGEKANITDIIRCRYEGWYYDLNGVKKIFDSTEFNVQTGESYYGNKEGRFLLSSGIVDGFRTMLMEMEVGDERVVCMPQILAYGYAGQSPIPGYTTLFFDIKLLEIIIP